MWGAIAEEDEEFVFGSDEEFMHLMRQRRKDEEELEGTNQSIFVALGVFLVACFEDVPQLAVNSYRVISGCKTDDLDMTTCGAKDNEYLWTASDTAIYFYSLKTAGALFLKFYTFTRIPERRRRIAELTRMIEKKTDDCKANRVMNAARAEKAPSEGGGGPDAASSSKIEDDRVATSLVKSMIAENIAQKKSIEELEKEVAKLKAGGVGERRFSLFGGEKRHSFSLASQQQEPR